MALESSMLESLAAMPRQLRSIHERFSQDSFATAPKSGGFSWNEHLCHLRDFELEAVHLRIACIRSENEPDLPQFEGLRLAKERDYRSQNAASALSDFEQARHSTIQQLSSLPDDALDRTARFGTEGVITMRKLIALALQHDAEHRQEIDELLRELKESA